MTFDEIAAQERARIIAEYRADGHPTASEREALADFVAFARNFQEWIKSDEAAQMKEETALLLDATRDALEAIRIEIEADDELATMSLDEALESGKLEVLIDPDIPLWAPDEDEAAAIAKPAKRQNARQLAIERGAVMSLDGLVTTYSHKELQHALDGFSLFRLPVGTDDKEVWQDDGQLNQLMLGNDKPLRLTQYQAGFFYAVNRLFDQYESLENGGGRLSEHEIELYIPQILRDMGVDPRTYRKRQRDENGRAIESPASARRITGVDAKQQRLDAMLELISPFEGVAGKAPNGNLYRALSFVSYDEASETIVISSPFLAKIRRIADGKKHPLHRYLHSSVVNERNQAAVELANRIIIGIVQRGYRARISDRPVKRRTVEHTETDGTKTKTTVEFDDEPTDDATPAPVVYRVSYQTLIDDCPLLKDALEAATTTQHYNEKLRQTFEAAFRIIETKSDLPKHYKNLTLPTVRRKRGGKFVTCYESPTKSTTRRNLIITHEGRP